MLPKVHSVQSIKQSWIFRVVQVIKSLQDPLKVEEWFNGIDDNVRKLGLKKKCVQTLTEDRKRRSRGHVVRQTVPNGRSGDWKGPVANGRHRRHQQKRSEENVGNADQGNRRHETADSIIATLLHDWPCTWARPSWTIPSPGLGAQLWWVAYTGILYFVKDETAMERIHRRFQSYYRVYYILIFEGMRLKDFL